jgi:hypothetical protein
VQAQARTVNTNQSKLFPFPQLLSAPVGEIEFTVDDECRAIFTRALGTISGCDFLNHIFAKAQAGVLSYAELFDARDIVLDLSGFELPLLAVEVRRIMGQQRPFKIAVVANNSLMLCLLRKYAETIGEDERRFRIFDDVANAQSWLTNASFRILRRDTTQSTQLARRI